MFSNQVTSLSLDSRNYSNPVEVTVPAHQPPHHLSCVFQLLLSADSVSASWLQSSHSHLLPDCLPSAFSVLVWASVPTIKHLIPHSRENLICVANNCIFALIIAFGSRQTTRQWIHPFGPTRCAQGHDP